MDVCFHVKNANAGNLATCVLFKGSLIPQTPNSLKIGKVGVFEIKDSRRSLSLPGPRPFNVEAKDKNNNDSDSSSSSENGDDEAPDSNNSYIDTDWRDVRAMLYKNYQVEKRGSGAHEQCGTLHISKPRYRKWAHPLSLLETGCVLVATEKLEGAGIFERAVVFLVKSGTRQPEDGPFGVVINRPLHKKVKHMRPSNNELATTFADCSLLYGGPLEASMFLLRVGRGSKLPGLEEVIPGLWYGGSRNNLGRAAELVRKGLLKPQNFKFFVGYAGWQQDQLIEEIESGYWLVASCSPDLVFGDTSDSSSESLRMEILQAMWGYYRN